MVALSKYKPTGLNGYVEFAIPGVTHSTFPTGQVTVSGRYRRINASQLRSEVPPAVLNKMADELSAYAKSCGFGDQHSERYTLKTMALTAVQFSCHWFTTVPLDSKKMEFFIIFIFMTWLYDDGLEEGWFSNALNSGSIEQLKFVHATMLRVSRKQDISHLEPLPEIAEFPEFLPLIKYIKGYVRLGVELTGEEFQECIEPIANCLQLCFECNEWFTVSRLDSRYSLPTYNRWRAWNAGAGCVLEAAAFAEGVRIPWNIRKSPAFLRMENIMMTNVLWVNDILGVKKDFGYKGGEPDNEIVFRVLCKGENLDATVAETCNRMEDELRDLILIKQALVDIYGEEENLLKFLDIVDTVIDGDNQVYVDNIRYQCERGFVRLTREGRNGVVKDQAQTEMFVDDERDNEEDLEKKDVIENEYRLKNFNSVDSPTGLICNV